MPSPFPLELWALIARHAIARHWSPDCFNPPLGDFKCLDGFAKASKVFEEIVNRLRNEALSTSLTGFTKEKISSEQGLPVRHLVVWSEGLSDFLRSLKTYRSLFIENLSSFSRLTSLSFCPPWPPLSILEALNKLPVSNTLRSIDIRGRWELDQLLEREIVVSFPNLLRLRLSYEPWETVETIKEKNVHELALFFSGCHKLELFSIHAALDDDNRLFEQRQVHAGSIDHLQPSEGYEREMADCPLCFANYDHSHVVRLENAMTRVLAQKLRNLSEVRWANLWISSPKDEYGQRATQIRRADGIVVLLRDDGLGE